MAIATLMKAWEPSHMAITITKQDSTFTPGEAERVTGVSTVQQRDWRRRGFLSAGDGGWTMYRSIDLAELLVMRQAAALGVGPAVAKAWATSAAWRIQQFAEQFPGVVEDQTEGEVGSRMRWHSDPPQRFLIVTHGTGAHFTDSIDSLFGSEDVITPHTAAIGSAVVIDLRSLALELFHRAGRPLAVLMSGDGDAQAAS